MSNRSTSHDSKSFKCIARVLFHHRLCWQYLFGIMRLINYKSTKKNCRQFFPPPQSIITKSNHASVCFCVCAWARSFSQGHFSKLYVKLRQFFFIFWISWHLINVSKPAPQKSAHALAQWCKMLACSSVCTRATLFPCMQLKSTEFEHKQTLQHFWSRHSLRT